MKIKREISIPKSQQNGMEKEFIHPDRQQQIDYEKPEPDEKPERWMEGNHYCPKQQ